MKTIDLEFNPTKKQSIGWKHWLDDITRTIIFGGGAGGGKSWLGCELILMGATTYPGSRWFIARNELKRLMATTYKTWQKVCNHHEFTGWRLDGQYNIIYLDNGSEIHLLDVSHKPSDSDYQRLGSYEFTGGFGDEIGEWAFDAFDILKSRIGRNNVFEITESRKNEATGELESVVIETIEVTPKFFGACNPTDNWVKSEYYLPYKAGELPEDVVFVQSLYQDNPHTAKSYESQLKGIKNEQNRKRLMEGEWEFDGQLGVLMKNSEISDMFHNTIVYDGNKYMTVDVARYGGDRIVINLWNGLESYKRIYKEKQGIDKTAQDVRDLAATEGIPYSHILVDDDGVGGGLVDILLGVRGFVNNSTPLTGELIRGQKKPNVDTVANFRNLKSQCAFKLAELVRTHKISCKNADGYIDVKGKSIKELDVIMQEMAQIKQKNPDKEGKLQIIPKEEVKDNIGRSPDVSDTFLMRAWFELAKSADKGLPLPNQGTLRHKGNARKFVRRGV